ncbi:MAG: GWxTD domain-containing protein [bacterium]|nr:GWxTD domain-containing protein [bacterium]
MASTARDLPERRYTWLGILLVAVSTVASILIAPAFASVTRLDGMGAFHTSIDVVNRWRSEDQLDVIVLVEVVNADLAYQVENGGYVGRLRVEVELESDDGWILEEKRPLRTKALSADQASSRTEFQIFGVLLENVPFRIGRIRCRVFDVQQTSVTVFNSARNMASRSDATGLWSAHDSPRPTAGLALEDPLFLAHAPLMDWRPGGSGGGGLLHDYAHPARRYGLEQERLQLYVPIWPQAGGVTGDDLGLRVQVTSLDMEFALTDTVEFDAVGRAALAAGLPASLIYELDINLLPEGTFLLNLAPLSRQGRGQVAQFDVVWRLEALIRSHAQVLGEGRTVFHGDDLRRFLRLSPAEQEVMLKEFWVAANPDPESPVNEAYLEFQYRIAFVRQFLGGFSSQGAEDARGEVFLALGMPDEIQTEHMPTNFRDQDDARIRVFEQYAPERAGAWAKGNSGSLDPSPYGSSGGALMPESRSAENIRTSRSLYRSTHMNAFEFWRYDRGGSPLWESQYSNRGMGQRFLFVDRTGAGDYIIESSNVLQGVE